MKDNFCLFVLAVRHFQCFPFSSKFTKTLTCYLLHLNAVSFVTLSIDIYFFQLIMKSPAMYEIKLHLFKVCNVNAWRCLIYTDGWTILISFIAVVAKL